MKAVKLSFKEPEMKAIEIWVSVVAEVCAVLIVKVSVGV